MVKDLAPLVLFVYNRPDHTRRTLNRLTQCEGFDNRPFIVFADGPKSGADRELVAATRQAVADVTGDHARVVAADGNRGLAASIINGVGRVLETHNHIIVLEDDLLVAPQFLQFMDDALEKYENDHRVMQVSGYLFSGDEFNARQEAFFLPLTTSWGWGTWSRAWRHFDPEAKRWTALSQDDEMRYTFNLNGAFDYAAMLENQMAGRIDSWAIRWYWSVFTCNGLVVYPPSSLVKNVGFDGSGTHGWRTARKLSTSQLYTGTPIALPERVAVNVADVEAVCRVFRTTNRGILSRAARRLKQVLRP